MVNEILEKFQELKVVIAAWNDGPKTNEVGFIEKVQDVITDFCNVLNIDINAEEKKEVEEEKKDEE